MIKLMRSNKIHENLMKNQAFDFFSVGEDYQRNVVENKNMVKGVITFKGTNMTTVYVSEENLKSLVHHKLHTAGLDTDTTQQVTDVLVHADITGVHSHGVMRVEHYCTRLAAGGLNKAPQFSIEQISPSVAILDSDDGMGHSALISATEHAIKLAQQEGLGFVSVKNTSHCGALSYFAEMITNKGLVAIVMTQTDTCVAPMAAPSAFWELTPSPLVSRWKTAIR